MLGHGRVRSDVAALGSGSNLKPKAGDFSTADTDIGGSALGTQVASFRFESSGGLNSRMLLSEPGKHVTADEAFATIAGSVAGALGVPGDDGGLGQLTSVLEAVAKLDPEGELQKLSQQVMEVRAELNRQLSRRRDYEEQLKEARRELDTMREERTKAEVDGAAARQRVTHLQDELGFVQREINAAEEDLAMLRESHGGGDRGRSGPAPYSSAEEERRDVLSKVRSERELLQADQRSIDDVRRRLDEVFRQKEEAQILQQSLLEKQRQTEQDRGLMLTAIEAERNRLSDMRAARIRLCEERRDIQKELTDIAQERWLTGQPSGPAARGHGGARAAPWSAPALGSATPARGARAEELPPVVYGDAFEAGPSSPGSGGLSCGYPAAGMPDVAASPAPLKTDRKGVRN